METETLDFQTLLYKREVAIYTSDNMFLQIDIKLIGGNPEKLPVRLTVTVAE